MTDTLQSLIEKLKQVAETGLLPDGDAIDTSVMMWLENLVEQHQAEDSYQHPYVKIGKYYIAAYPEYIWIGLEDGAEGGAFDEAKLESVIDKFYKENF